MRIRVILFTLIHRCSQKFLPDFPIPAKKPVDPTRPENHPPATHRRRPGPRPTRLLLPDRPVPSVSPETRRKSGSRRLKFAEKVHRSPAPIPATSGHKTSWVLFLSSPAT